MSDDFRSSHPPLEAARSFSPRPVTVPGARRVVGTLRRGVPARRLARAGLALALAFPSTASASEVGPLKTFQGGTPALASEVNANFGAVKSAVDDNARDIESLGAQTTGVLSELATLYGPAGSELRVPARAMQRTTCSAETGLALEIDGAPADGTLLGIVGEEAVSQVPRFVVAFSIPDGALDPVQQVGSEAKIVQGKSRIELVVGDVTRFALAGSQGDDRLYHVTIEPELAQLRRSSGFESFYEMKVSDMINATLGAEGLAATVAETEIVHGYEVRWDETPLNFITRLMEREGMHYHVRPDGSAVFGTNNGNFDLGVTLSYLGHFVIPRSGESFTSFELASGDRPAAVTVRGWDYLTKETVEGTVSPGTGNEVGEILTYAPTTRTTVLAQAQAESLSMQRRAPARVGRGTSTSFGVRAGTIVSVADATGSGLDATSYLITAVQHAAVLDGEAGCFRYANAFDAIPSTEPFEPLPSSKPPRVHGTVSAVVTDNDDPDDLNRVKVKFPWSVAEEIESDWARTLAAHGLQGPALFPEIDDEVLVSFVDGDPRHPVVVGHLWNGRDDKSDLECSRARTGHLTGLTSVRDCVLVGVDWSELIPTLSDLNGANLTGANAPALVATDADMQGVILTGADVRRATFAGADLSGGAVLNAANLTEVDLVGANLSGASVVAAILYKADLSGAILNGVNFVGADLSNVSAQGAMLLSGAVLDAAIVVNANFTAANLTGAKLRLTDLGSSVFLSADLLGADLAGASLRGTVLVDANLVGANLRDADATDANFTAAVLTGADLRGVDLTGANFVNASLVGANLAGATLTNVVWANTICPDGSSSNLPDGDGFTCLANL